MKTKTFSNSRLRKTSEPYSAQPKSKLRQQRVALRKAGRQTELPGTVKWREDFTQPAEFLYLDADSFSVEPLFEIPPANMEERTDRDKYLVSPEGLFAYQNRILPFGMPLQLHDHGLCAFSDDVVIPMLIDLERDCKLDEFPPGVSARQRVYYGNVWMSLTPNEMISQRPGIMAAHGTVMMGGLGMGWFLRKLCEKESVERVIVVERSQELLDWYGYSLCRKYNKVCEVICDDVYEQLGRHGDDTIHLLDIWPTQKSARHDPSFRAAKERLGYRLWGWGE